MVGRDIEQHCDRWSKKLNCLELKRTYLEREKIKVFGLVRDGANGKPNVSGCDRPDLAMFEHSFIQLCGCGFPVRASYGDTEAQRVLVTKFQFADDRDTPINSVPQAGAITRYPGADDRKVEAGIARQP